MEHKKGEDSVMLLVESFLVLLCEICGKARCAQRPYNGAHFFYCSSNFLFLYMEIRFFLKKLLHLICVRGFFWGLVVVVVVFNVVSGYYEVDEIKFFNLG